MEAYAYPMLIFYVSVVCNPVQKRDGSFPDLLQCDAGRGLYGARCRWNCFSGENVGSV